MKELTLCFARMDRGLDVMVLARFAGPFTETKDLISRLQRAITKWVQETKAGQKLWIQSCEDLNIGDVADDLFGPRSSLRPFLRRQGIRRATHLHTVSRGDLIAFDTVLVDLSGDAGDFNHRESGAAQ